MVITLSKPNPFFKILSPLERGANCKQKYVPHYLWKFKVQTCDKLQTSCLVKRDISRQTVRRHCYCHYNSCSKCPPFARIHVRRRLRHSSIYCIVNDTLVHDVVPNLQQTLLQFINAVQLRLMHSLLHVTLYLAIDWSDVGAIRRPQIGRNESGCWLLKNRSVACPVCGCVVLLKDEEIAPTSRTWRQQMLRQEHVAITVGWTKMRSVRASFEIPT